MCFEQMWASARRGELLLIDGGVCHWHLRRDGQVTIREIIATRPGAGGEMLAALLATPGARFLLAKCPADLASNRWYQRRGFTLARTETARSGRALNVWRRDL